MDGKRTRRSYLEPLQPGVFGLFSEKNQQNREDKKMSSDLKEQLMDLLAVEIEEGTVEDQEFVTKDPKRQKEKPENVTALNTVTSNNRSGPQSEQSVNTSKTGSGLDFQNDDNSLFLDKTSKQDSRSVGNNNELNNLYFHNLFNWLHSSTLETTIPTSDPTTSGVTALKPEVDIAESTTPGTTMAWMYKSVEEGLTVEKSAGDSQCQLRSSDAADLLAIARINTTATLQLDSFPGASETMVTRLFEPVFVSFPRCRKSEARGSEPRCVWSVGLDTAELTGRLRGTLTQAMR